MKFKMLLIMGTAAILMVGCGKPCEEKNISAKGSKEVLTVDFKRDEVLRYKFTLSRDIEVLLEAGPERGKSSNTKYSESLETVVSYKPIKMDSSVSTIEARCESVTVKRNTGRREHKDAAENFAGKSFTFTVGPKGKIFDHKELEKIIKDVSETAFRSGGTQGRVKEPDMVFDFVATQWFLWDSISSIKDPNKGVSAGDSWKSQLSIPSPALQTINLARDVNYKLVEVRQNEGARIAVIDSTYSFSKSILKNWYIPYRGSFQISGAFGFYTNYKIYELQGSGEELFNIDAGRTERQKQNYELKMTASLMMPLGVNPKINIKQHISMQLIDNPGGAEQK